MTLKAVENIISFAEGGYIKSITAGGDTLCFSSSVRKQKGSKEREEVNGTGEYTLNKTEGILQVTDNNGTYFIEVKQIASIQMEL